MYSMYAVYMSDSYTVTQYDLCSKYSLGSYSYLYGMHRSSCGYNNILSVITGQNFNTLVCTVCTGKVSPLLGYTNRKHTHILYIYYTKNEMNKFFACSVKFSSFILFVLFIIMYCFIYLLMFQLF